MLPCHGENKAYQIQRNKKTNKKLSVSYLQQKHTRNGVENCLHDKDETGRNAKCLGVDCVKDCRTDHQAQHFNTGDCSEHCACIDTGNRNFRRYRQIPKVWFCLYALLVNFYFFPILSVTKWQ